MNRVERVTIRGIAAVREKAVFDSRAWLPQKGLLFKQICENTELVKILKLDATRYYALFESWRRVEERPRLSPLVDTRLAAAEHLLSRGLLTIGDLISVKRGGQLYRSLMRHEDQIVRIHAAFTASWNDLVTALSSGDCVGGLLAMGELARLHEIRIVKCATISADSSLTAEQAAEKGLKTFTLERDRQAKGAKRIQTIGNRNYHAVVAEYARALKEKPGLSRSTPKAAKYIEDKRLKVLLQTNGTLLGQSAIEKHIRSYKRKAV